MTPEEFEELMRQAQENPQPAGVAPGLQPAPAMPMQPQRRPLAAQPPPMAPQAPQEDISALVKESIAARSAERLSDRQGMDRAYGRASDNRFGTELASAGSDIGYAIAGVKNPNPNGFDDLRKNANIPIQQEEASRKLRDTQRTEDPNSTQAIVRRKFLMDQNPKLKAGALDGMSVDDSKFIGDSLDRGQRQDELRANRQQRTEEGAANREMRQAELEARMDLQRLMLQLKGDAAATKLAPDEQGVATSIGMKSANKISVANQIESFLSDWDSLDKSQQLARGRNMLKILNSGEGQDAVGEGEANRLGEKLVFALGNFTNDNPTRFGRDIPGFKTQAEGIKDAMRRGVDENTKTVERITGRKSKLGNVAEPREPQTAPKTAVNPKTGQKLILRNGQWQPQN